MRLSIRVYHKKKYAPKSLSSSIPSNQEAHHPSSIAYVYASQSLSSSIPSSIPSNQQAHHPTHTRMLLRVYHRNMYTPKSLSSSIPSSIPSNQQVHHPTRMCLC